MLLQRGVQHHQAGRLEDAAACYRQAIEARPEQAGAHANLGIALRELGRLEAAEASLRRALRLQPDLAPALDTLGDVLLAMGRREEAVACFQRALALRPDMANAHSHLGMALLDEGRAEEAAERFRGAIALSPSDPHAHTNLGIALRRLERHGDAEACFVRALELAPHFWAACVELGWMRHEQHRVDDSVELFQRALREKPDDPRTLWGGGLVLIQQGRVEEGLALWARVPRPEGAFGLRVQSATALPVIPSSGEEVDRWRARFRREVEALAQSPPAVDDPLAEINTIHFALAYQGQDDRPLAEAVARMHLRMCPALAWTAPHCREGIADRSGRRVRLGIASRYLTAHTVQVLVEGLIRELDRSRFEVVLMPVASSVRGLPVGDEGTRVVPLRGSLQAMRERVAEERLDVLLYPDVGMEPITYFLAFARLAPVQCVTWGHPVTTGIPNLDFFLSSDLLEPEGAEAHYSETLVRLRSLPACYARPQVPTQAPERTAFGLAPHEHLYLCPQSLFKLHPDGDALLVEILRRDPRGRLVLLEGLSRHWSQAVRDRLARVGPDVVDRVTFAPRMMRHAFLRLLAAADVLLDPPGFGGGNTTYEGLACGTPIVTWPGPYMRGRVTLACYRKMGWPGCVADSAEGYVDLAVRLACDPSAREAARREILARSPVLYDDRQAVREMEDFLAAVLPADHADTPGGKSPRTPTGLDLA